MRMLPGDFLARRALFKKAIGDCKKVSSCPRCGAANGTVKNGLRGALTLVHELP